jgi:hypothetical protein
VFPCGVIGDKEVDVRRTDELRELNALDKATREECKCRIYENKIKLANKIKMTLSKFMVYRLDFSSLEENSRKRRFSLWLEES